MNRIIAIVALLFALVACSREKVDETVAQVQALTVQICSFLPTVQTVTDIIAAASPAVKGANAIAKAICDAVTANPAAVQPALFIAEEETTPDKPCPEVNGVCIKGEFVLPKEEKKPAAPLYPDCKPGMSNCDQSPGQDVPKAE